MKEKLIHSVKDNAMFLGIWAFALSTVLFMNFQSTNSLSFVGVTDSKEVNINLKHPVLVKKVHVLPGQLVQKGQLLVELERPDLVKQMNEVSHKLEEFHNQLTLNETLANTLKSIKNKKQDMENALTIQIRSLENQYEFLRKEQEELFIFAQFDGHVGFVNYKSGESVSPFAPIVTMHQKTPTFVRGYVHESIINKINIGSKIKISSSNGDKTMIAHVTSVGTRIIEFPERFRRSVSEKIWGREVGIKLTPNNEFLLGEKVFLEVISNEALHSKSKRTLAYGSVEESAIEYNQIVVPELIKDLNRVEPSGLVFIPELKRYLMVSDDTFENKPFVYLLNNSGEVDQRILLVDGVDKIKDMESMTMDEQGNIYIASSQSETKKNKISKSRRSLIKVKREGLNLIKQERVRLIDMMNDVAVLYPDLPWVKLLKKENLIENKYMIQMDLEGLAVKANTMYLGLRNTFGASGEVVILKIVDAEKMFETDQLTAEQVSVYATLKLPESKNQEGISDLLIVENKMFILTADNKDKDKGRLLKLNMDDLDRGVSLVKRFNEHRPEGISYNSVDNELLVVFDNNKSKRAFMTKVKL